MIRFLLSVIFAYSLSGFAAAHEFWLEPETFRPDSSTRTVPIQIKVGMNFAGNPWGGKLSDIIDLPLAMGSRKGSLMPESGLDEPVIEWKSEGPGQYLLGLTNNSAFIELTGEEFEKYVISEGLERIVEERKTLGESEKPGRELYRRCAKLLLQQGDQPEALSYNQEFGFPVEFQALGNPYEDGRDILSFKLLSKDGPLADAQVIIWHKDGEQIKKTELRTNQDGIVTLLLRQTGFWMVSAVHMERIEGNEQADWQSYWASYTFGFK
jgi:uncharacterized GH25 family protein